MTPLLISRCTGLGVTGSSTPSLLGDPRQPLALSEPQFSSRKEKTRLHSSRPQTMGLEAKRVLIRTARWAGAPFLTSPRGPVTASSFLGASSAARHPPTTLSPATDPFFYHFGGTKAMRARCPGAHARARSRACTRPTHHPAQHRRVTEELTPSPHPHRKALP